MSATLKRRRRAMLLLLAAIVGMAVSPSPVAAETFDDDDATELAERYAPVVVLVGEEGAATCDNDAEQFAPMSVDAILDNRDIALRQLGADGGAVVQWAPSAQDLFDRGEGFYLDFPGDALAPACIHAADFARYAAATEPTVYAHVVTEDDRPGHIVVQYWFYWYFNDWNNTHESDWEGIQVVFPASTPAEALTIAPTEVGFAQHEGGQREEWSSGTLQRQGDHPLVFPSRGSHASYFEQSLHLGRSAAEGFGCDTTIAPSRAVEPTVVLFPDAVDRDHELAWLDYEGRWGERNGGPYNGPLGPNTKERWTEPITWQEGLTNTSLALPTPDTRAGALVDGFCSVVEWGSNQVMSFARSPLRLVILLGVLFLLVRGLTRRTVWDPTPVTPIAARRRSGSSIRTALSMLRAHPGTFGAVGLLVAPFGVAIGILLAQTRHLPVLGGLVDTGERGAFSQLVVALASGAVGSAAAYTVVTAIVASVMRQVSAGRDASVWIAAREAIARFGPLAAAFAIAAAVVVLSGMLVILAPVALYLLVRVQFMAPVVMLEPTRSGVGTLRRSVELTTRRWWATAVTLVCVGTLLKVVSTTLGLLVLVVLRPPFWMLAAILVMFDTLLAPLSSIILTYLYGDALATEGEPASSTADPVPADVVVGARAAP